MASSLPPNVHVSTHPCLRAKLSQFRSKNATGRETNSLVHEIANIVGCEALGKVLRVEKSGTDESPLGYTYNTESIRPQRISVVPILRSGLGMVDAITSLLPTPVPVHHLGLFREPTTLQPVEYYNNLPYHTRSSSTVNLHSSPPSSAANPEADPSDPDGEHLALILDPIIATGGTAVAAIQTLREWGVSRVAVLSVLASAEGVRRAAAEWEGAEIWVGAVDEKLDARGMIAPGVGDVGDRLFLTKGK